MEDTDIIIQNGSFYDGTGSESQQMDIAISDCRITHIESGLKVKAKQVINAKELIVCPGFIDVHSHSDMALPFDNRLESTVRQGITTSVIGNCGFSLAPVNDDRIDMLRKDFEIFTPPGGNIDITWRTFDSYLNQLEENMISSNIVPLVGFGAIRMAGGPAYENRPPSQDELDKMKAYTKEAMEAGAYGLSTGLIYPPQVYASTEEIIEVSRVAADYGGLYFSHIRGEGETVVKAVQEVIDIVEKSGCAGGQIAHHKVAGKHFWGTSKDTLQLISDANARGISITCDQYPYNRGSTSLISILPPWVHEGGVEKLLERLRDPETKSRIAKDIEETHDWENLKEEAGWDRIFIASVKTEKWKDVEGLSLREITQQRGYPDEYSTLFELLSDENAEVTMTMESMGDEDIERIMKSKYTMIGTDGAGVAPTGIMSHGKPHPRHYGTYPRILGRYVREKGLLKLEEAIHKMTGFPAQRLGFNDRGLLKVGNWADIVVFNPQTVIDTATFMDPHQFSIGIQHVIVNGVSVVSEEGQSSELPGKVLRRRVSNN
ncbi:MAG: N-acyl-D-amino-acid deacylase family protein [Candidatus Thorarchaeota archaeon]|jgi:N-acyl-D-amino-acid deacylase